MTPELTGLEITLVARFNSLPREWATSISGVLTCLRSCAARLEQFALRLNFRMPATSLALFHQMLVQLTRPRRLALPEDAMSPEIAHHLSCMRSLEHLVLLSHKTNTIRASNGHAETPSAVFPRLPIAGLLALTLRCDIIHGTHTLNAIPSRLQYLDLDCTIGSEPASDVEDLGAIISERLAPSLIYLKVRLELRPRHRLRPFHWNQLRSLRGCSRLTQFTLLYATRGTFDFVSADFLSLASSWPRLEGIRCEWYGDGSPPATTLTIQDLLLFASRLDNLVVVVLTALSWRDRETLPPLGARLQELALQRAIIDADAVEWIATVWAIACPFTTIQVAEAATQAFWTQIQLDHDRLISDPRCSSYWAQG